MTGERANDQFVAYHPMRLQLVNAADVDQDSWRDEPQIHHRHQALAAGDNLGVLAMVNEHFDSFGKRAGTRVIHRRSLHASTPIQNPAYLASNDPE